MISGILFFLIAWIMGALFKNSGFAAAAIIKAMMLIISGSFGGVLGVNYKRK